MGKRVVAIVVLLVVVAGAYLVWRRTKESRELASGEVHGLAPVSPASPVKEVLVARRDHVAAAPETAPAALPVGDSAPPNAPNGVLFGGNGTYQWYRQGDVTWRLDTASGRSCIVFATMEQWRKEIVYSHGCGRNA